jgi:DNA (cytosine-5)-methyltransferase 1
MTTRPRLLDLYCGAGGGAVGYWLAGFDVTGVDIARQPNYPFRSVVADALTYPLDGYDVVHASPPCHDHSTLRSTYNAHGTGWLLAATLDRLAAHGAPWIVENVGGARAEMGGAWVTLCGSSFGLGVRRHRLFATSFALLVPPCAHYLQPEPVDVTGGGPLAGGSRPGHRKPRGLSEARAAMGIGWMTRAELNRAIPPAYTEFIGEQLLAYVEMIA